MLKEEKYKEIEEKFKRGNKLNSFSKIFKNIENSLDEGKTTVKEGFYDEIDISHMKRVYRIGRVSVSYLNSIPKEFKNDTEIVALKNKTLFIKIENPIILQELNLIKEEILDSINSKLEYNIDTIIFKLGKIKIDEDIEEIIDDEKIPVLDLNNSKLEFEKIEDKNLREKLNNIFDSFEKIKYKLEKKGYIKCKKCGNIYSSHLKTCDLCNSFYEREINRGLLYIKETPWSSKEEFIDKTGLSNEIYIKSKEKLEMVLLKSIKMMIYSDSATFKKIENELINKLIIYFNVKENKFISSPNEELIKKYFEKEEFEYLKKSILKIEQEDSW
jgi:hypothetical protein